MSASVREQLLMAIGSAVNSSRPAAVPEFIRARLQKIQGKDLPAATWAPIKDTPQQVGGRHGPIVDRVLEVDFELTAKASAGVTADAAIDEMAAWVRATLPQKRFGGLVVDVRERDSEFLYDDEVKEGICKLVMHLEFRYTTKATDANQVA